MTESERKALAQKAAGLEAAQAEVAKAKAAMVARDKAELARRKAFDLETAQVRARLHQLGSRVKEASDAVKAIRAAHVHPDLRLGVSAAEREVRRLEAVAAEAKRRAAVALEPLRSLRERVERFPAGTAPRDLLADIDRVKKSATGAEGDLAVAEADLVTARARESKANADHDAALRAALAV